MAQGKNRSRTTTIKEIDMTPLIDLTFLLLIVFMITMPMMEYGVNVKPPVMNADPLPDENNLVVNLTKDGDIMFEKRPLEAEMLTQTLQSMLNSGRKMSILLRADGSRQYTEVMDVMKAIKKAGVKEISLVTEAEKD